MGFDGEVSGVKCDDPLRIIRVEISSLLVAEPNPVTIQHIERRYEEEFGTPLEPMDYGFYSTEELLGALTDKIVSVTMHGLKLYRTKFTREFKDLQKLVQCQTTKEERRVATYRKQTRVSQFGSKFRSNFVRTGGFENFSCSREVPVPYEEPLSSKPNNMISSVYSSVKKYGIPNKDGFLSMSVKSLQECMNDHIPLNVTCFGEFCELLRSPEFAPHWRIEVKFLNGSLEHTLTMNIHIKREQSEFQFETHKLSEPEPSPISSAGRLTRGGRQLAINSLRSALWINREKNKTFAEGTKKFEPHELNYFTQAKFSSVNQENSNQADYEQAVDHRNLPEASVQSFCAPLSEVEESLDKLNLSSGASTNSYMYSRKDMLSLRDSSVTVDSIREAVVQHPKVSNTNSNNPLNDTMSSRFSFSSARCEGGGFSQNIIHPISKEESEVYRQIEQIEEPVRTSSSRFVGPSSTKSSLQSRTASPSFGSQLARSDYERNDTRFRRVVTPNESLRAPTPSSASRALEKMNEIDNEIKQLENAYPSGRPEETKQALYSGITERDLASLKLSRLVQDPSIDDIKMCAPMYFVPPCSVLICFENGNEDSCARFCEIQQRLQVYYSKQSFEKLKAFESRRWLGTICIARSADSNEFARVVIVDINDQVVTGACLDYHGFVTADFDTLAVLPDIFSPKYLPCNIFLSRINGIQAVPNSMYKAVADSIAERSTESNEFILFTTAIFGIDPHENKIVVDWITSEGCWKSTELTQKFQATHRSSDPQHPTSDEVDKATEELESTVAKPIELKWFFTESEKMLRKQVEVLQTMCAHYDRPESSSSNEHKKEKQVENIERKSIEKFERFNNRAQSPESLRTTSEPLPKMRPVQRDVEPSTIKPSSHEFGEEHIVQLGILMNSLSKQLYPEVRSTLRSIVGGIAELAKNASGSKNNNKSWDTMMDSLK